MFTSLAAFCAATIAPDTHDAALVTIEQPGAPGNAAFQAMLREYAERPPAETIGAFMKHLEMCTSTNNATLGVYVWERLALAIYGACYNIGLLHALMAPLYAAPLQWPQRNEDNLYAPHRLPHACCRARLLGYLLPHASPGNVGPYTALALPLIVAHVPAGMELATSLVTVGGLQATPRVDLMRVVHLLLTHLGMHVNAISRDYLAEHRTTLVAMYPACASSDLWAVWFDWHIVARTPAIADARIALAHALGRAITRTAPDGLAQQAAPPPTALLVCTALCTLVQWLEHTARLCLPPNSPAAVVLRATMAQ